MIIQQNPIRKYLADITKQELSEHGRLLKSLRPKFQHSILKSSLNNIECLAVNDFNCFEYTFGLIYSEEYKDILEYQKGWKITPVGADKDFLLFMLRNNNLNEVDFPDVQDENIIVYFDSSQPTHAGNMLKGRVKSKWGKGLLLEHEIFEVPELYGNEVKFYTNIPFEDCIDAFISYAEERGIEFEEKTEE